jgi:hypothetical protein
MVVADLDPARAHAAVERHDDPRLTAIKVDASDEEGGRRPRPRRGRRRDPQRLRPLAEPADLRGRLRRRLHVPRHGDDAVAAASRAAARGAGVKLGDEQFADAARWEEAGLLALVGIGVEPGLSDVFARHAADELFSEIDEVGVRDGANLVVEGYDFAPTFSIWTTIEECLNPPLDLGARPRLVHDRAVLRAGGVRVPGGIGPVECVNVEHEEVVLIPRWVDCRRVTFKYGLGEEFIDVLRTLHKLGLDSTEPSTCAAARSRPRDVVAAALPDPATLGDRMRGETCAGTLVTGTGKDGSRARVYLYHVADNEQTMREYGARRSSGRRRSTRSSRSSCWPRHVVGRRACSVPRPSPRRRSWRCWPTTARRTDANERDPADPLRRV